MNKDEFDAMLPRLRDALEEAERLLAEAKLEYGKASARFKEARRMHNTHVSWGRAMGFVEQPDILDEVVAAIDEGGVPAEDVALVLNASRRAVAGALRRAVNKGLLVRTEDGYARA